MMAVEWSPAQVARVEEAITQHPADSGQCADLARRIVPIGQERDPDAHALLIRPRPRRGRYVLPRIGHLRWQHHVTSSVEAHCVDALTGASGMERENYLEAFLEFADDLRVERTDLEDSWL